MNFAKYIKGSSLCINDRTALLGELHSWGSNILRDYADLLKFWKYVKFTMNGQSNNIAFEILRVLVLFSL